MKMMVRSFVVAVLVSTVLPGAAWAQSNGDVEIFFGVHNFRPTYDGLEAIAEDAELSMWGVHGDIVFYFSDSIGIVLDGSFPRTDIALTVPVEGGDVGATVDFSQATYLVGPRLRFNSSGAITPSLQALVGWSSGSVGRTTIDGVDVPVLIALSDSSFAFGAGASLDVRLGESFALRLLQASVVFTSLGDTSQTTVRLSAGIVGRF